MNASRNMSMKAPRVSIVIPSRTGDVSRLRDELSRQTLRADEVIVKAGIAPAARARNLGAADATGTHLIFLDDDITFAQQDVLERLVSTLESCGPEHIVGAVWRLPERATWFQRRFVKEGFGKQIPEGERGVAAVAWNTVGTACFGVARATFESLGGFDEQLISGEDYDFAYRLHRRGGGVRVLTQRWFHHLPPASFAEAARKAFWYERGNAQVARKYPEAGYRLQLKNRWHAVAYLALRTVALLPLMFVKMSFHHRRPQLAFRPIAATLSYIGAWVYCVSWFAVPVTRTPQASAQMVSGGVA